MEELDMAVAVLWAVWCSRNKKLFDNHDVSLHDTISHAEQIKTQMTKYRENQQQPQDEGYILTITNKRNQGEIDLPQCRFSSCLGA